jgi:quinol monooxygenase YgiN
MAKLALYVPLHVKAGKQAEIADWLRDAVPLVSGEPGTIAWFAIQEAPSRFGIFETFDDEAGRDAHLNGPVARALMDESTASALFEQRPNIHALEVLTDKLPHVNSQLPNERSECGLYIPLEAKLGKAEQAADFLRSVLPLVIAEPDTVAWFAIQESPCRFAIFAAFEDETGRDSHFNGNVARAVMESASAGDLFVGIPEIRKLRVLADKLLN